MSGVEGGVPQFVLPPFVVSKGDPNELVLCEYLEDSDSDVRLACRKVNTGISGEVHDVMLRCLDLEEQGRLPQGYCSQAFSNAHSLIEKSASDRSAWEQEKKSEEDARSSLSKKISDMNLGPLEVSLFGGAVGTGFAVGGSVIADVTKKSVGKEFQALLGEHAAASAKSHAAFEAYLRERVAYSNAAGTVLRDGVSGEKMLLELRAAKLASTTAQQAEKLAAKRVAQTAGRYATTSVLKGAGEALGVSAIGALGTAVTVVTLGLGSSDAE